jgi:lipoprotein-releasing system ATP-binding protein
MKKVLIAEHLNKYFHEPVETQVLHDVSLSLDRGQFVTVMGKSGSGKSSLMYVLATLDTDYNGNLFICDERMTGLTENQLANFRNRHIGFIFQYHYLLPEFTALQNVMIPALKLKLKSSAQVRDDAMALLEQMQMGKFAGHLSSKLSGGQQQRVAIARALINHPDIIMADEPTGNLDSGNTAIIFNIFRKLADEGNTIIAITHDMDFVQKADAGYEIIDGTLSAYMERKKK